MSRLHINSDYLWTSEESINELVDIGCSLGQGRFGGHAYRGVFRPCVVPMTVEIIDGVTHSELQALLRQPLQLVHPNLFTIFGYAEDSVRTNCWAVFSEELSGGTIEQIRRLMSLAFHEEDIAFIICEILKALDYLHCRGTWHGALDSSLVHLCLNGEVCSYLNMCTMFVAYWLPFLFLQG